jgi:hypothetical protein
MNGHLFPDSVAITNYNPSNFAVRIQTKHLWYAANHTVGKKTIVLPYPDVSVNHHVGSEFRAGANRDPAADNTIGADRYLVSQFSIFMNHRAGVYLTHFVFAFASIEILI